MSLSHTQQSKRRMLMMVFGAFAIFFTGYPHVWSVYQPYMMELAGWSQGQASMCFYLVILFFVFGNIFGGRIQDKYNPGIVILAGGALFAAGVLLSALFVVPSPFPMYITYGIVQGFGQGMVYATVLSTAQKWFPDRTGLASGIVVTANGISGFVLAPVSRRLLEEEGPERAFLEIGIVIAISWILGCIFIRKPDPEEAAELKKSSGAGQKEMTKRQYTSVEMLKTKKFYLLVAVMTCGLLSYFMISPISQTLQIERGVGTSLAVKAVMFGSLVNAGARLFLPWIADKAGRIRCVRVVLIVSFASMVLLAVSGSYFTTIAVILMYGCYGGIMGSFPSLTSSIFGIAHSGENYGYVMSGVMLATVLAPAVMGAAEALSKSPEWGFITGIIVSVLSYLFLILLKRELKKENSLT